VVYIVTILIVHLLAIAKNKVRVAIGIKAKVKGNVLAVYAMKAYDEVEV
jgi:hypothetical protein